MLKTQVELGFREIDILYKYNWIKKNGLIMCPECQRMERGKEDIRQQKTA